MTDKIDRFENKYYFLSNFYYSPMVIDGVRYNTVEHYFQAMKCESEEEAESILSLSSPAAAKKRGRLIKMRENWDDISAYVMFYGILEKFKQNKDLRSVLLDTGNAKIEEGNVWHDNLWGDCKCERCKNIAGQNRLGSIIESVRLVLGEKEV